MSNTEVPCNYMPFFDRCGPLKTKTKKWSLLTGALRAFVNEPFKEIFNTIIMENINSY